MGRVGPAILLLAAACGGGSTGGSGGTARSRLVAAIDSIITAPITTGKLAGASIAVIKGSDTIAVKAYGKANVELDVPTPARATYEIGSVTKQFTGAAIMQLVEQGKINLDDDVTKYLPDLKTGGRKIPVRRLLDHTSGIKGYTEIPEFRTLMLQHIAKDSLVRLFMSKPFDFEPGEEEIYNNSAFFLSGLIIEKVSGKSYADYVKENLFDKAGMKDAHYCSERVIHKNKATGYDSDSTGMILKGFLDHTWPFSAGSLCSSALDLAAWNQALHGGRILGPEAYKEFTTPYTLNDGTRTRYAKGIAVSDIAGHAARHHGGGINGFLSENLYFPDDTLSVVVLFNTGGPASPNEAAREIGALVLGKPADPTKPFDGDLSQFAGVYKGHGRGRAAEFTFAIADGKLTVKGAGSDSAKALSYLGDDTFTRDPLGLNQNDLFIFAKENGKVRKVRVDAVYGNNVLTKQ